MSSEYYNLGDIMEEVISGGIIFRRKSFSKEAFEKALKQIEIYNDCLERANDIPAETWRLVINR